MELSAQTGVLKMLVVSKTQVRQTQIQISSFSFDRLLDQ